MALAKLNHNYLDPLKVSNENIDGTLGVNTLNVSSTITAPTVTTTLLNATNIVASSLNIGSIFETGSETSIGNISTSGQFIGSGAGLTSIPNGALVNSSVTINGTSVSLGGSISNIALPAQSAGTTNYYLQSNGTSASWVSLQVLPTQTSNSGKILTTDGTNPSWTSSIPALNIASGAGQNVSTPFTSFNKLTFDNAYNDTSRGPNKIQLYNDGNSGIFGFSVHSSTLGYYSAPNHTWYNSTSQTSFTQTMTLDGAGNLVAVGDITTNSDSRLKDNVEPITDALAIVEQINGVTYSLISDDKKIRHVGLIAQDVEAVMPEAVLENENGIKSVAYGNLVGLLVEAIKELRAEVTELRGIINGF